MLPHSAAAGKREADAEGKRPSPPPRRMPIAAGRERKAAPRKSACGEDAAGGGEALGVSSAHRSASCPPRRRRRPQCGAPRARVSWRHGLPGPAMPSTRIFAWRCTLLDPGAPGPRPIRGRRPVRQSRARRGSRRSSRNIVRRSRPLDRQRAPWPACARSAQGQGLAARQVATGAAIDLAENSGDAVERSARAFSPLACQYFAGDAQGDSSGLGRSWPARPRDRARGARHRRATWRSRRAAGSAPCPCGSALPSPGARIAEIAPALIVGCRRRIPRSGAETVALMGQLRQKQERRGLARGWQGGVEHRAPAATASEQPADHERRKRTQLAGRKRDHGNPRDVGDELKKPPERMRGSLQCRRRAGGATAHRPGVTPRMRQPFLRKSYFGKRNYID